MDMKKWFKQAGLGMMVHWGLYSVLGGEYKGRRVKDYAEWIGSFMRIPNCEYEALAKIFNPIKIRAHKTKIGIEAIKIFSGPFLSLIFPHFLTTNV